MATTTKANNKRMYSWWWDSHISPKNSKWLQENLTDMDAKVKQMIKLLEEDADSFARRAEMYYKKRPELMKLVEEFYRAYRALAERYDNATGVLRQAHRTMAEAFPNQEHFMMVDDSPAGSAMEADPRTPDDLQKDASGTMHSSGFRRNGGFTEESDSVNSRKGLRQFNDLFGSGGRARKGLFQDEENPDLSVENNGSNDLRAQVPYDSELLSKAEQEISTLKDALSKLEADKEAAHLRYQQTLEKLSYMELEVSRAKEESRGLTEKAETCEDEVQTLKEAITSLKTEHEAGVLQCQQYADKISDLEERISQAQKYSDEINERASKVETEANSLKQDLARVEAEKESALIQQKQSLEKISDLEGKLLNAEEDVRKSNERADEAERELDTLKQALANLIEEKEAAAVQYMGCLEKIVSLERKLALAEEENKRLNSEIADGVAKFKDAVERCVLLERSNQSMHSELESLSQEMAVKREELTEKQQELGRLWTGLQEERLRFVEAETAFQTLQHLHNQSQDELKSLAAEFQKRTQILEGLEVHNQSLRNEVEQVKVENIGLNELNLSSALTIRDLQAEILHLRETIGKLETNVEVQVDQRNALQQEIYSLKDELKDLEKNQQAFLEQVESVGFSPDSFPSQVKNLMDDNMQLKEDCERSRGEHFALQGEHLALLEKLSIMDKLIEKNAVLENSLSDLNVELEGVRSKVKELEESCQSLLGEKSILLDEKSSLVSRLQIATDNLENIVEKNNSMELSLLEARSELEGVQLKCKSLEELCLVLTNEKSDLTTARESLMSDLDISGKRLESLSQSYGELEQKHFCLEKERESILNEVEGLRISLDSEKHERVSLAQQRDSQLAGMQLQISKLQEEVKCKSDEYEAELDNALNAQIEIFVLQESIQDFSEKGFVLLFEHQKLLETSKLSGRQISELERENLEQQIEVKSLFDQMKALREGVYTALKTLDANQWSDYKAKEDKILLAIVLNRIHEAQRFLFKLQDENHKLVVENSLLVTLIGQLRIEVENLVTAKKIADQELSTKTKQILILQGEGQQLAEMNGELGSMLLEGELKEEVLKEELRYLWGQLSDLQGVHRNLHDEKCKVLDEQTYLKRSVSALKGEKHDLEENYASIVTEAVCQKTLSVMFKDILTEKFAAVKGLLENSEELLHENDDLKQKLKLMEGIVDEIQVVKAEKENFLKMFEDLRCKNDDLENIRVDQEGQIKKLFEDSDQQRQEAKSAQEANQKLESEMLKLLREMEETKCSVEGLNNQLQISSHDINNWESEAEALFGELQTSALLATFFEEKVHDLAQKCENLGDKSNSQAMEIDQLKESAINLHAENEELKSHTGSYLTALSSLKDSIAVLEKHTVSNAPLGKVGDKEEKDTLADEEQSSIVPEMPPDCQELQVQIKAIERALVEKEKLLVLENSSANSKLEAAVRCIEELKSEINLLQGVGVSKHDAAYSNAKELGPGMQKHTREISAGGEVITKDIILDQISECSSHGISRRETLEANDPMLEMWEMASHDGSIDSNLRKTRKKTNESGDKKHERGYLSTESLSEKDFAIDKLEISKNFSGSFREGNEKKILERLDSDAQKLTNLDIIVRDLKMKVEVAEKSRRGKGIEYGSVKEQLEESEEAISKLLTITRKLKKAVEDEFPFLDEKSVLASDEAGVAKKRKIAHQARRGSEKIGRLQMEVQKLMFLLAKLDESRSKGKIKAAEPRVLLQDYLYGRTSSKPRRKKGHFCFCLRPQTEEN